MTQAPPLEQRGLKESTEAKVEK